MRSQPHDTIVEPLSGSGGSFAWGLLILAALFPLAPLAGFNPDFVDGPVGWSLLAVACVGGTALMGFVGSIFGSGARGVRSGILVGLTLILTLTAAVVAGVLAAILAFAGFVALVAVRLSLSARVSILRAPVAVGVVSACLLLTVWASRPPVAENPVIMIGIDGATWDVIDELRAVGRLPTLNRILETGARGTLAVRGASISPSLWTTIATGVSPASHGIRDFWASSNGVLHKRVWELADEAGLVSGVMGYLVTWPPEKENGFLVPGWLAQDSTTVPGDLAFLRELEDLEQKQEDLGVLARLRILYDALRNGAALGTIWTALGAMMPLQEAGEDVGLYDIERRRVSTALWSEAFCHQLRTTQPDLGIFYQHHVDAVEHLYFAHYKPAGFPNLDPDEQRRYEDFIPQIYVATDRAIERIQRCAPPNTTFVILSDHGQVPSQVKGVLPLKQIKTTELLRHLGVEDRFRATTVGAQVYVRAVPSEQGGAPEADIAALTAVLRGAATTDGRPVFSVGEAEGNRLVVAAIPYIGLEESIVVDGESFFLSDFVKESGHFSGAHNFEAIFILHGPRISSGRQLPPGRLVDVAPTVLALLGLPVARDLEGQVLRGMLRPEARGEFAVEYVDTYGRPLGRGLPAGEELDEATRARLRTLGYIQ